MLEELRKVPKRPRGRPKGSTTKPKDLTELLEKGFKPAPRPIKHKAPKRTIESPLKRIAREDPERHREWQLKGSSTPKRVQTGRPKGMTIREWAVTLDEAQKLAKNIMKNMDKEAALPENALAREAMQEAVTLLASELPVKDKLAVIRTILEYNMAKPAATNNVNIKTAEDYLDELAAKE